jgi:hypothetical protein
LHYFEIVAKLIKIKYLTKIIDKYQLKLSKQSEYKIRDILNLFLILQREKK